MSDHAKPPAGRPEARRPVFGLLLGAGLFVLLLVLPPPEGMPPVAWRVAAVAALMAIWWVTEAIPIPATALLPLVLFPLLGVAGMGQPRRPMRIR